MSPETAQLAGSMREVRAAAGLSLAQLARSTSYSKSSWARYLAGTQPVPRRAVEALCEVAGVRPERLLALWELADARWSGRARAAPEPRPERPNVRRAPYVWGVAAGLAAATVAAVAVLLSGPYGSSSATTGTAPATFTPGPGCSGRTCEGRNPLDMGCGGQQMVRTLAARTAADGRSVQLRDSAACHALWARATRLHLGDRVELTLPGTSRKEIHVGTEKERNAYLATPMTALTPPHDPGDARVCLIPADGRRVCFTGRPGGR
ncbi:helix-turn-helix domain-containing protein [Streptomyces sp. NPDC001351]|uniref:helix-turn-helix domain-containing protein n=1 Tax=Streptomyces sp. NPDC001351 TaxID=3364564 RepID=UPI00367F438C